MMNCAAPALIPSAQQSAGFKVVGNTVASHPLANSCARFTPAGQPEPLLLLLRCGSGLLAPFAHLLPTHHNKCPEKNCNISFTATV